MLIERIRLQNFRCHSDSNFELEQATFIEGENGSGKTSILEAVYLLLHLKSFKEPSPKNLTKFNEDYLRIKADYSSSESSGDLLYFFDNVRTLKKDGSCVMDIPDYLTQNPVFCYSPDTSTILAKEQKLRRSYIDRVCFYRDRVHIFDLRYYNRLIAQKTIELQKPKADINYLESINEQIFTVNEKITERRKSAVIMINKRLDETYVNFGKDDERFSLDYINNKNDINITEREIKTRKCLYGNHRDKFYSKNMETIYDKFSSYGQKKTFELLVLYAVLLDVEVLLKTGIITLLDDFEAGLDERRAMSFLSMFAGNRQILVTGVKNRIFGNMPTVKL